MSLAYLESIHLYAPERSWQQMSFKIDDAIEYVVIILIITAVSWISNSETEKSLERAKKSEKILSKERDNLEIKVLERTKELRQAQLEKMVHIYRFVEFGRLSSGLFHDLMSPLTAISVALEGLKNTNVPLSEISEQTLIAVNSSRRISNLLQHARKHIHIPAERSTFSINEELRLVIDFLSSKWKKSGVILILDCPESIKTFGNSTIFTHIATNIISNAIDAYEGIESNRTKKVNIDVLETTENIQLKITDFGHGIKSENISSIFEPFFTTKDSSKGTGLGLSATKHTLEKYFKGQISVTSSNNTGTTFYVEFPKKINLPL
jgi:signal transduction histidine kinase